nr:hypothetical protein [uncultured Lichenicoccus sp.]
MWQPWRGLDYKPGGVLLLAESCYDWKERGVFYTPQPDHSITLVQTSMVTPLENSRMMRKLTRAIADSWTPTPEASAAGWNRVAFTNYIPVTVGRGAAAIKTNAMWRQAEAELPALLNSLEPSVVVVLGLIMWTQMPPRHVTVSDRVGEYRLNNGRTAMCFAHKHPSWGRGPKYYSTVIDEALELAQTSLPWP